MDDSERKWHSGEKKDNHGISKHAYLHPTAISLFGVRFFLYKDEENFLLLCLEGENYRSLSQIGLGWLKRVYI